MALELFLVPMIGTGEFPADPYRPKYIDDANVNSWGALRYSRTDECIVLINAPQAYLDGVAAQSDATALATPTNIDSALTQAQANATKTILEGLFIPSGFVNEGDTRRSVIRIVAGLFLFAQRLEGLYGEGWRAQLVAAGVTLDTPYSDLPQAAKDRITATRENHGWGTLGLDSSSTVREIMRAVARQFADMPLYIGGQAI